MGETFVIYVELFLEQGFLFKPKYRQNIYCTGSSAMKNFLLGFLFSILEGAILSIVCVCVCGFCALFLIH